MIAISYHLHAMSRWQGTLISGDFRHDLCHSGTRIFRGLLQKGLSHGRACAVGSTLVAEPECPAALGGGDEERLSKGIDLPPALPLRP